MSSNPLNNWLYSHLTKPSSWVWRKATQQLLDIIMVTSLGILWTFAVTLTVVVTLRLLGVDV